jgi:hypothetical protein
MVAATSGITPSREKAERRRVNWYFAPDWVKPLKGTGPVGMDFDERQLDYWIKRGSKQNHSFGHNPFPPPLLLEALRSAYASNSDTTRAGN